LDVSYAIQVPDGKLQATGSVCGGWPHDKSNAAATYASVVLRESIRIALTIAALNDLEVLAADVKCVVSPFFSTEKRS
jgi:hypothetical protein